MKRPKPWAVGKVRVRVHSGPRADGRWRWRADLADGLRDGREVRRQIWSGWATRDEAEALLVALVAERGIDAPPPVADVRTVADLLSVWTADKELDDRSAATTRARNGCADRLSESSLAAVSLAQLARPATGLPALQRWVRAYQGARSTCRSDLISLRAAWTWGRLRELVPDAPLPDLSIEVRDEDRVATRYVPTDAEVLAVLERLRERRTRPPLWPWRAIYLLWATGCRPGEIATLTWDRVDGQILRVTGKTGARPVAVHSAVAAEIGTWPRDGQTVHGAAPASVLGYLHVLVERACMEAGCERWSLYGLRRAAVDRVYRRDRDPSVSGAALGHSARVALETYRTVTLGDLVSAAEEVGLGVVPETPTNVVPLRRSR
jgi:integrase